MSELPKLLHTHALHLRASHPNLSTVDIEFFLRQGAEIATRRAEDLISTLRCQMAKDRAKANCPQ